MGRGSTISRLLFQEDGGYGITTIMLLLSLLMCSQLRIELVKGIEGSVAKLLYVGSYTTFFTQWKDKNQRESLLNALNLTGFLFWVYLISQRNLSLFFRLTLSHEDAFRIVHFESLYAVC